jgi:HEAT repeat protein
MDDLLGVLVGIGAAHDPEVERALTDRSETVRHLAAMTLVYGDDAHGGPVLKNALEGDEWRGVEAATSVLTELIVLGTISEDEAFDVVRRFSHNIEPQIRRNAVRALVLFEDEKPVREVLESALGDTDEAVVAAAREAKEILERAG